MDMKALRELFDRYGVQRPISSRALGAGEIVLFPEQLSKILAALKPEMDINELNVHDLFARLDTDNDGALSFDDLSSALADWLGDTPPSAVESQGEVSSIKEKRHSSPKREAKTLINDNKDRTSSPTPSSSAFSGTPSRMLPTLTPPHRPRRPSLSSPSSSRRLSVAVNNGSAPPSNMSPRSTANVTPTAFSNPVPPNTRTSGRRRGSSMQERDIQKIMGDDERSILKDDDEPSQESDDAPSSPTISRSSNPGMTLGSSSGLLSVQKTTIYEDDDSFIRKTDVKIEPVARAETVERLASRQIELKAEVERERSEKETLERQLNREKMMCDGLRAKLDTLTVQNDNLVVELEELKGREKGYKQTIKQLQDAQGRMEGLVSQSQTALDESQRKQFDLSRKLKILEDRCSMAKSTAEAQVKFEMDELRSKVASLTQERLELERSVRDLQTALTEATTVHQSVDSPDLRRKMALSNLEDMEEDMGEKKLTLDTSESAMTKVGMIDYEKKSVVPTPGKIDWTRDELMAFNVQTLSSIATNLKATREKLNGDLEFFKAQKAQIVKEADFRGRIVGGLLNAIVASTTTKQRGAIWTPSPDWFFGRKAK